MQKPTVGDSTGLVDTMEDLLVDSIGAAIVVLVGYRSAKRGPASRVSKTIHRFVVANPRFFPIRTAVESDGEDR